MREFFLFYSQDQLSVLQNFKSPLTTAKKNQFICEVLLFNFISLYSWLHFYTGYIEQIKKIIWSITYSTQIWKQESWFLLF